MKQRGRDKPDELEAAAHEEPQTAEDFAARIAQLEGELEEARQQRMRALADFQNYQKRALINERDAREEGIASAVRSVVSVLDHFDIALDQPVGAVTLDQLLDGVTLIKQELLRVLAEHGVSPIEPRPGAELNPMMHEAVMQEVVDSAPAGSIARVYKTGYRIGDRVLRPAQVSVAIDGDAGAPDMIDTEE